LFATHPLFGFFHARSPKYDVHTGRSIHHTYEFASHGGGRWKDGYYGYFAHYLVGVEVGIEEWIAKGDQEQEDERAFIAKDAAQLVDTGGENSEHKGLRFRRPTPVPSLYGGA
jgi:hypothetical protein